MNGCQRCSNESWKTTLDSIGTYLKMGRVTAQKESTYLFSGDVEEGR
jgi:hypothetical protein